MSRARRGAAGVLALTPLVCLALAAHTAVAEPPHVDRTAREPHPAHEQAPPAERRLTLPDPLRPTARPPDDGWNARVRSTPAAPPRVQPTPAAAPQRVRIPVIAVDAPLLEVGLLPDGALQVPPFGSAGWYALGPAPGAPGPAVLAGHVDSPTGPDVFGRLDELVPGDLVMVERVDGSRAHFQVSDVQVHRKEALPSDAIWPESREPVLRLITCGGAFDQTRRSYTSNVVVFARLVPPPRFV